MRPRHLRFSHSDAENERSLSGTGNPRCASTRACYGGGRGGLIILHVSLCAATPHVLGRLGSTPRRSDPDVTAMSTPHFALAVVFAPRTVGAFAGIIFGERVTRDPTTKLKNRADSATTRVTG
jgi:hypothetical protein